MLGKQRDSNLELYRIVLMLMIVAHHYVVNSGLMGLMGQSEITPNLVFLYLFGMWGKTGINCFVLITGYFMCRSSITFRKFLKLLLEVEFYNVVIYFMFVFAGVESLTWLDLGLALLPVRVIGRDFVSCYLVFYLCIPFLNVLVRHLGRTRHLLLIGLGLGIYTVYGTVPKLHVTMNYVSWFCVLFFIGAYLRKYGSTLRCFHREIAWGRLMLLSVAVSCAAVWLTLYASREWGTTMLPYYWVEDSNKLLAVTTAVCSFMYFKNLRVRYNPFINKMGACMFGVLLIHSHSNTMRRWLWGDLFNNIGQIDSDTLVLHAVFSVAIVFAVCAAIDYVRQHTLERWCFQWIDKTWIGNH